MEAAPGTRAAHLEPKREQAGRRRGLCGATAVFGPSFSSLFRSTAPAFSCHVRACVWRSADQIVRRVIRSLLRVDFSRCGLPPSLRLLLSVFFFSGGGSITSLVSYSVSVASGPASARACLRLSFYFVFCVHVVAPHHHHFVFFTSSVPSSDAPRLFSRVTLDERRRVETVRLS